MISSSKVIIGSGVANFGLLALKDGLVDSLGDAGCGLLVLSVMVSEGVLWILSNRNDFDRMRNDEGVIYNEE